MDSNVGVFFMRWRALQQMGPEVGGGAFGRVHSGKKGVRITNPDVRGILLSYQPGNEWVLTPYYESRSGQCF